MASRRHIPGIGYWPEKAALMHPDRLALVTAEGRFTYGELSWRVAAAERVLRWAGVGRGDRFGILMLNDVRFLELLFAAGRVGAVAVTLNWRLTVPELLHPLRDAGVGILFVGSEQEPLAKGLEAEWGGRVVRVPEEYDAQTRSPETSAPASGIAARSTGATATGRTEPDVSPVAGRVPQRAPGIAGSSGLARGIQELPGDDDPVLMVYTSGTTGNPKGAVLTHANLFWNAINDILALGISYRDTTLTVLPLMHVGGIGLFTLPTLLAGGTVVMTRGFDAEETLRLIESERVTLFLGVPTIHRMLTESAAFGAAELSSLRLAYNGGDACPMEVVEAYRRKGIPFGGGYGLTETAPTAFLTEPDQLEDATRSPGFAGKAAFSMESRIVDESGGELGAGETGELLVRGPNLFRDYWGLADQTAESFTDGWFRTGDLAYRDDAGFHYIAGRKKEMLKSGGENIYPAEVERVLESHPAVAEACVIGRPHPKWREVPFAVVALREGARATEADLRGYCRERLAGFKVPASVAFVGSIPRTSIGKPDRPLLKERYGAPAGGLGS